MRLRRWTAIWAVGLVGLGAGAVDAPAAAPPQARLKSEAELQPVYNQGIARIKDGEISLIQQDDRIGQGWMRS